MAVLYALIAMVSWGVGDVFGTLSSRKKGNMITLFWVWAITFVIFSTFIPWAGKIADISVFLVTFFITIPAIAGMVTYFRGLEIGNASLVGAIGGSFSIVTVPLAMIFFHERISLLSTFGIILAILGIILSSIDIREIFSKKMMFADRGILLAIATLVLWGFYYAFIRIPVERIGWYWAYFPGTLAFLVFLLFKNIRNNILSSIKDKKFLLITLFFALCVSGGTIFYYKGILSGETSIVAPIATTSPVLFVVLSRFIFKDKLTLQQKMGIISSLLGIVMIGMG